MNITLLIDSLSLTRLDAHHEVRAVFRLLFLCTSWNWFSSPVRLIFTVDFHVMKAVLCWLFPIFICQSLQMLHVWLLLLHPAFDVCSLIGNCTFRCLSLLSSQSSSVASTLQNVTIIIALLKDFCQLTFILVTFQERCPPCHSFQATVTSCQTISVSHDVHEAVLSNI